MGTLRPRQFLHDKGVHVERHGSETYFVLGEGVLGESLGGREETLPEGVEAVPQFRFSRLGPKGTGKQLGEPNRRKIAEAMTSGNLLLVAYNGQATQLNPYGN